MKSNQRLGLAELRTTGVGMSQYASGCGICKLNHIRACYFGQCGCRCLTPKQKTSPLLRNLKPVAVYLFCILLNSYISQVHCQIISGMKEICTNEGEEIQVEGITDDPCITCFCQKGIIRCYPEKCSPLSCHVVLKRVDLCCPYCQECVIGNQTLQPSDKWYSSKHTPCVVTNCNNGIYVRSQQHCYTPCNNPQPPSDGECCPTCSGCQWFGGNYKNGDIFSLPIDPCVECSCQKGNIRCSKKICPVLACSGLRKRQRRDVCCPECVGKRYVFDLGYGDCWFQRNILRNLEEVTIDRCTNCICQNGTVVCNRTSCPVTLNCARSEWIYKSTHCCPMCPEVLLRNCTDQDGNICQHGREWMATTDPCLNCRCNNGTVTCTKVSCDENPTACGVGKILERTPGQCCKSCIDEPGVCTVFGDPHYRTFDGRPFNFQGDCMYMLAKDCLENNFTVIVQNDAKRSRTFAWTKSVFLHLADKVDLSGINISLHQRLIAKLNGRKISLPHIDQQFHVTENRGFLNVRTAAGVSLKWDGDNYLEVGASPRYKGNLCGFCGNFNGFSRDDYIGGDGIFKEDKISFAESWRVGKTTKQCSRPTYDVRSTEPCHKSIKALLYARKKCYVFKSKPFQICHNVVDPSEYYKSCLTDTCECPRNKKCSCESIRAYVSACIRQGVKVTWKKHLYCKKICRRGQVFSSCGPACKITCKNYKNTKRNKRCMRRPCVAGCHCVAGYVLKRNRCVKTSSCLTSRSTLRKFTLKENPFTSILRSTTA